MQISGDESGSDGENLSRPTHRFFSYGTTDLSGDEASELIREVRRTIGSTDADAAAATELKSGPVVAKHASKIARFFGSKGPLGPHASIYVADKPFFLAGKMISLLVEEEASSRGQRIWMIERQLAVELHDGTAPNVAPELWADLLDVFNRLVRFYPRPPSSAATASDLVAILDRVRQSLPGDKHWPVVRMLWDARRQAAQYDAAPASPVFRYLEPLVPALLAVSSTWTARYPGQPINLVVDTHSSLTSEAVDLIVNASSLVQSQLQTVELVDSKQDPRVQLADLIAGVGRHAAQTLQDGKTDALTAAAVESFDANGMWSDASPLESALRGAA